MIVQVITHLIESELVVADITTRNANAFYELGIRHMLQKPIIHMFRRGDHIPADIAPYRAVEFAYSDKDKEAPRCQSCLTEGRDRSS